MTQCDVDVVLKEIRVLSELQTLLNNLEVTHPLYEKISSLVSEQEKEVDRVTNECGNIDTPIAPSLDVTSVLDTAEDGT